MMTPTRHIIELSSKPTSRDRLERKPSRTSSGRTSVTNVSAATDKTTATASTREGSAKTEVGVKSDVTNGADGKEAAALPVTVGDAQPIAARSQLPPATGDIIAPPAPTTLTSTVENQSTSQAVDKDSAAASVAAPSEAAGVEATGGQGRDAGSAAAARVVASSPTTDAGKSEGVSFHQQKSQHIYQF
jgi:hypothetical protein